MKNCFTNSEKSADKSIEQQDEYWDLFDAQMNFVKSIRKGECITSRVACVFVKSEAYESYLNISTASPKEERVQSYFDGIQLNPKDPRAFRLLIKTYAEDGSFDRQESEAFLSLYNTYQAKLDKNDSEYGKLLKDVGYLYANGYEDSPTTRIRMALPFLREAQTALPEGDPQKAAVSCYCLIGAFYEDYIWDASSVREISPTVMQNMIAEIEETLSYFKTETSPDALFNQLGFDVAVCNLLYDQRDVLAVTVSYDVVTDILDTIYRELPQPGSLQKDQTRALLLTLESNKQTYYDMLARAYSRKEET